MVFIIRDLRGEQRGRGREAGPPGRPGGPAQAELPPEGGRRDVLAVLTAFVGLVTFIGFVYAFGAKTITEKNNGARVTAAGLLALAILATCW